MSQENVEFLRRFLELADSGELAGTAELFHPDVEVRDLAHLPDSPEMLQGHSAIVRTWRKWLDVLDNWTVEVSEYIDADPSFICATRWHATGKWSGAAVDWEL